jgi:hypothetical protein
MRLTDQILEFAKTRSEGTPLTAKRLLHLGSRAAVDQALSRLARRGHLIRAERGVYLLPVGGRFGSRPPAADKVANAVAEQEGRHVTESGAAAANALGLTNQVPVRAVFLTSGRPHELRLGKQLVELKPAPGWQLGRNRAGRIVRALHWLGRERINEAASVLRGKLTPEERRELSTAPTSGMPGWLAKPVAELAHG